MKRLWQKIKTGLSATRQGFTQKIDRLIKGKSRIDQATLDELEEILILADLGISTTQKIMDRLREKLREGEIRDASGVRDTLRDLITGILMKEGAEKEAVSQGPQVIMVIGVNGVGKTTSIAKLAHKYKMEGKRVLLAAGDTFRAAGIDQLDVWARRIGVDIIKHQPGADPSAVVFDALQSAKARGYDVVIADTAGRQHTKVNLMEELKKMKRVMDKVVPGAPHEVLLVLDANTGQNAVSQTNLFHQALGVTGIILTKLDSSAKGGIVINIADNFNIPVKYIGLGEDIEDLQEFNPEMFASALLAED